MVTLAKKPTLLICQLHQVKKYNLPKYSNVLDVTSIEGITDEDVDKTIHNLTKIGFEAMIETNKLILKIMTTK